MGKAAAKYALGVVIIVAWRIAAKMVTPLLYEGLVGPLRVRRRKRESGKERIKEKAGLMDKGEVTKGRPRSLSKGMGLLPSLVRLDTLEPTVLKRVEEVKAVELVEEKKTEKEWRGRKRTGAQGEGEVLKANVEVVTKVVVYFGIGECPLPRGSLDEGRER